ncbi:helix-turn-helix domain-containing protein [uncultured Desulfobulbus sp.]|uniref:helix-turn-helix domain-containing protein n=1 Tax=uncultured Desulfobulbus sp. TaxID=239745 RepID=UPI0029C829ED|nr:helix-turn-helix domain-containing protein [uncultured Desulfobulbus sp.]
MDAMKKKRVSSGIPQLDSLLGGLYIGDNVLWYEDAGSFSATFCVHFIRESLALKKPTIYVSFDRSPKNVVSFLGPLAESQNFTILDCFTNGKGNRSEVFNRFYEKDGAQWPYQVIRVNDPANPAQVGEAIYGLHGNLSGDIRFIMDSLTGMQDLWGGEEQVTKFYARTCPRLYELDTIAYWIVEKSAHTSRLKANINKIAQVAIDLSVKNSQPALKILKAEKRNSQFLNDPQSFSCEEAEIAFDLPKTLPGRFDLGGTIKAMRKKQGLSQKELAEKTGVTPSSISQIEKNLIYPSIPALFRLAESLSVEVASFFEDLTTDRQGCVYRGSEGVSVSLEKAPKGLISGTRLLPPDTKDASVDPYLLKIEPGSKLVNHFFSHKGEEMGYVVSGTLALWVDGQRHEAGTGDFVYLTKQIPEQWENVGENAAELLWLKIK